jgi:signal transduction histidine kinase/CheY-like chemotaxis protein
MTIQPQTLRAERFDEIGAIIRGDATILIECWRQRAVADSPDAGQVHREALLNHLPALLAELGRSLAESNPSENGRHTRPAREHGEQRWEVGWSLPGVVRDYQLLRLVILEYLEETLERPLRYREAMAVGLGLDDAIRASVVAYVENREDFVRHAERRAAAELEAAQRHKDEFLAVLAHELRNFLAPAVTSAETLRRLPGADAAAQRASEVVERQLRLMTRLVDDLLDVARIARGELELRKERVDLAASVSRAVQAAEPLIQSRQHALTVTSAREALWVDADPARLVQIITNLLHNAAKYTAPGGRIELLIEKERSDAVVRVRDNGAGLAPEELGRVFEPFTRLRSPDQPAAGGLGIGLALIRRLVECHGGSITAASAGRGRGCEFIVRLPSAVGPVAVDPGPSSAPIPARPRRIVLVEDNEDGRNSLCMLLRLQGHQVEGAADGTQGLDLIRAVRPRVALVDLGLPRLDGYEVARQVRAEFGAAVYLVALTGYGQEEDRRKTAEAGFDAHLVKPVDPDELTRLLAGVPA